MDKKLRKWTVMKRLLLILILFIPMTMFSKESYKVRVQKANVRSQPSKNLR